MKVHKIYIEATVRARYRISRDGVDMGWFADPLPKVAQLMVEAGDTGMLEMWDRQLTYYRAAINLDDLRVKIARIDAEREAREKEASRVV